MTAVLLATSRLALPPCGTATAATSRLPLCGTATALALALALSTVSPIRVSSASVQPPAGRQSPQKAHGTPGRAPAWMSQNGAATSGGASLRGVKGDGKARKSKYQPHALLYGTVFDEGGRLVRGAQIEVRPRQDTQQRTERWEARSDSQGEFAVHLPVGKAVYIVEARAPGFTADRKEVEFTSDERQDVVVHLKRP